LSSLTVIVPTLNEAENIDPLLERLFGIRRSCNLDFDVLFVDSSSTDGTCDRVLAWQKREPVRLLQQGKKMGLAGAVIAGAKQTQAKYVLVMDADLSHPPEAIPILLAALLDGSHDMVIGSRYIAGGSVPGWTLARKIASRLATVPARLFCRVKDPLAGFFAVERWRLSELPDTVPGFKIGLALLSEYGDALRVAEIPIEFRDRDHGVSKMTCRVAFAYLKQLGALFSRRLKKLLCRFCR
jgi:dolichol-phosphate mannosyltransferase